MSEEKGIGSSKNAGRRPAAGQSYFLGIGINQYRDKAINNLNNARKDVEEVLALLQKRYHIDQSFMLLDEVATRGNIIERLDELPSIIGETDKLLIYYSGHGYLNSRKRGFWIPHDAVDGRISTYISTNYLIRDLIADIPARHTLLISDSCFSGALFASGATRSLGAARLEEALSRWAFCSGRQNEKVLDGPPGGNSPFAAAILKNLEKNREEKWNVSKLVEAVRDDIARSEDLQLPDGRPLKGVGDAGGQYVFQLKIEAGEDDLLWQTCQKAHTIAAYNDYLDRFPNGKYADAALDLIQKLEQDEEAWRAAQTKNKVSAYQLYLKNQPEGRFRASARTAIQKLLKDRKPLFVSPAKDNHRLLDDTHGLLTDGRDGQKYKTIRLGDRWWLAENLRFEVKDGWIYDGDPKNLPVYGRLYTWEAAKKACPSGWRLPTDREWMALAKRFGGYSNYEKGKWKDIDDPVKAYQSLIEGGNSGFAALLGGWRDTSGSYSNQGVYGGYWSGTERDASYAWYYYFFYYGKLYRSNFNKGHGFSVRCLQA